MTGGSEGGWRAFRPGILLLTATLAAAAGSVVVPPGAGGTLAAVFAPGTAPADIARRVAGADGRFLSAGGLPNIWLVHSDDDGFAGRLYRAGAWLVLDPGRGAGCGRSKPGIPGGQVPIS